MSPSVSIFLLLYISTYQYFSHLDWTWGPIREKFLDQGKRGEIWEQWAPCQTHLGLLLADKEWVCVLCVSTTTPVIMLCFPVMSNVFLRFSPLPHPSPLSPDTMSISILLLCFHQPLKVRISRIHFPFSSFFHTSSQVFLTLPFLCSEDTLHIYIIQQRCVKTASHTSSWINHTCVCVCLFIFLMCPWLVVQRHSLPGKMKWDLGTEEEMDKGRRVEGGIRRRSLMSFD